MPRTPRAKGHNLVSMFPMNEYRKPAILLMVLLAASFSFCRTDGMTSFCTTNHTRDTAHVTCFFSDDITRNKRHVTVKRYPLHVGSDDAAPVLGCVWLALGGVKCIPSKGYVFNNELSDRLTVTISNLTEDFEGRYICSASPTDTVDNFLECNLTLRDGNSPAVTTGLPVTGKTTTLSVAATKDENNAWIIGIVVAVLGLLLFTAVVFILHRKQRLQHCLSYIQRLKPWGNQHPGQTPENGTVPAESTESQVKSGVSEETVQLTTNTSSGSERNEEGPNV